MLRLSTGRQERNAAPQNTGTVQIRQVMWASLGIHLYMEKNTSIAELFLTLFCDPLLPVTLLNTDRYVQLVPHNERQKIHSLFSFTSTFLSFDVILFFHLPSVFNGYVKNRTVKVLQFSTKVSELYVQLVEKAWRKPLE